jgi:cell wall-associated NlpC family hydrolase
MAERGLGLRRRFVRVLAVSALATTLLPLGEAAAHASPASWRDGEDGSGPAPIGTAASRSQRLRTPGTAWSDLGDDDRWAKVAIDLVAGTNDWMRDYAPDADGNWRFRPDAFETRQRWARALVRAFAADEAPDPAITFPDLDRDERFWPFAAIAVKHRWIVRTSGGRFEPDGLVTARSVHRALILVLGMGATASALDRLSTDDGYRFRTPTGFGFNLLAMRLGLRYNNKVDESQDVAPIDQLRRKQVAWSLYRAASMSDATISDLEAQFDGITLPRMGTARRKIVDWGVRYVGYPYIWGGEWGLQTPEPSAFGVQPGPGFDCSGFSWWVLRHDDDPWDVAPPRPYAGWSLPQRTSAEMARMTQTRLRYRELLPGDLMFYDGDLDGTVDHVDVFVGNGWSLDSGSSVGGVSLIWNRVGWYREHFVHGRRVLPRPKP